MKTSIILSVVLVAGLLLFGCADITLSSYALSLPQMPENWAALLGEPHWRVEWLDPGGERQVKDILPGSSPKINLPVTWVNPVTAWPWWPEHNLIPGLFGPAGAIFPFDVSGGHINLTWEAAVDTVFYWELAFASSQESVDASKIPANFDWMRFRELFRTDVLNEEVCKDPWLVDWHNVAQRTISSSFDRRRLTAQSAESVAIPVPCGHWYGASPFAAPLVFTESEQPVFPVRPGVNVWVSEAGILRVSGSTWVFTGWSEKKKTTICKLE